MRAFFSSADPSKPLSAPSLQQRPDWFIPERQATPESVWLNRRGLMKGLGGAAIMAAASGGAGRANAAEGVGGAAEKTADLYPAERNEAYKIERELTPEEVNSSYNNFYEYGSHKQIAAAARRNLVTDPWSITIDGLVDNPETIAFEDLVRAMPLEERLYRLRCVEAWSMTIPWTGFPLRALLARVSPRPEARYVRFETFENAKMASGQRQIWYPWPYVEGVTLAEAQNDLSFLVTGAYGKPIGAEYGAPIRLALPWKYGFKSIKSLVRISFTDERPVSFWEQINAREYGFWANVNPEVAHPRWSQARERVLHTREEVPTQLFNGYGAQVAGLYAGLENEALYR
ncbi:protein-methionine-sulfoxide reductase catalytic subunit MsrP [Pseudohoeflea coraliihabitans]|uniref:Protein-methionine-sulfoxide reductase catalytic subunit MsrP n=1 Tax=Pseudohoeflea coraliihabitans TaxID=2860393 RepID=A0ABS6WJY0_9HYPH|nr:protein-methionine-sulfoxide reductase catalytic subunit MsrP [Pseudohoeflea sp. DP4N28-3]MBW3096080.1 protein-methionine-sulfoxide reductase catalytic subunit MsrP [Pseudohoeflea sp. DP4N28-3]